MLDGERTDLDAYVAIAEELAVGRVVDVGCGTGCLAVRMAELGLEVGGVDPAADLAVMTGNVAQVFVSDDDWARTLDAVRDCLRPEGWFVFETRRPEVRDWERWDVEPMTVDLPGGESVVVSGTERDLAAHGFEVVVVREAPDRPGKELVLLARRTAG